MKATLKSVNKSIDVLINEAKRRDCNLGAYSKVNGCMYASEDGRRCAIGFFFTDDQIEYIKDRNLNDNVNVTTLALEYIGEENLVATTGFNVIIGDLIQTVHDCAFEDKEVTVTTRDQFIRGLLDLKQKINKNPEEYLN